MRSTGSVCRRAVQGIHCLRWSSVPPRAAGRSSRAASHAWPGGTCGCACRDGGRIHADVAFLKNEGSAGGALALRGSTLRARNVEFVENQADGPAGTARQGGAVWAKGSLLSLEGCSLSRNYASTCDPNPVSPPPLPPMSVLPCAVPLCYRHATSGSVTTAGGLCRCCNPSPQRRPEFTRPCAVRRSGTIGAAPRCGTVLAVG